MSNKKKMEGNPDANLASIGNYNFVKTLGEGNFAKVKLAKHKITNQEVAIKIIDKMSLDDKKLSKLYREVRIMKLLHHPNIVKLYEVIETKYTIFLVMEYVSGGELYDYLVVHGRMKEKEARAKFRQILSAVSYCHKKRVIHRDLKAENLLLDKNLDIKIADFGFSNQYDPDGKLDTFCGSPPYAAPELFQGKRYTGPEVDVWSLGVILYVLTTGCLPFDGKNLQEMRESVCRGKYRIPFYLSEGCEKLLRKFLVRDPLKRPTLDILVDDTWLNDGYEASPVMQEINEENINEDALILSIIESKFGVPKDQMIKSLRENVYDETLAIYFMLWDEKRKNGEATVIKIGEQMAIKPGISGGQTASPKSEDLKHTPIGAIQEEGSGEVVTVIEPSRRRSTAAPQTPEITPKNGASAVPSSKVPVPNTANATVTPRVVQPVRRQRRFTVAGEAEMKKMAEEEKADPEILSKLRDLQVSKAEESIVNKAQDAEFAVRPRVHTGESRPRPVSIAATNDSHTTAMGSPQVQKATEKKSMSEEEKKAQATKKPSGITGFLKIRRNTVSTNGADQGRSTEVATTANGTDTSPVGEVKAASEESVSSTASGNGELKPRSLRFTFNSNTTSSKPPDDIVQEVSNACAKHNIKFRVVSRYLVEVTAPPPNNMPGAEAVKIEIEVCKLPRLKNLHGLRFKRLSGASADYKTVCEQLLAAVQL